MRPHSRFPMPRSLKMPLRDILRGVVTVADVTEEILEPATALLPASVQGPFRSALATFEEVGNRAVTPGIDLADIEGATAFLQGTDTSHDALQTFVGVLAFVWERALARSPDQHLLFSETVAMASLAVLDRADGSTSYARAAAVLSALSKANAASRFPGTPMASSADEHAYIHQTLFAACVWLLAERASHLAEEERLLELALALTHAREVMVLADFANEERLAEHMQRFAEHL